MNTTTPEAASEVALLPCDGISLRERIARALYAARPFVMGSTSTSFGVSIGRSFHWDGAPAYYQADMLQLADAVMPLFGRTPTPPPADALARDALALIDEIEALWVKAGSAPWIRSGCHISSTMTPESGQMVIYDEGGHDENDAASIVALHNAFPRLRDAIRASLKGPSDV